MRSLLDARFAAVFALLIVALLVATGCQTNKNYAGPGASPAITNSTHSDTLILREGDTLSIVFPGAAPSLSGTHLIERDGNIIMPIINQIRAAGRTIPEFKADLLKAYSGQVETKEVIVDLVASTFPVYVTGAVMNPGKVLSDHPITVLEAIMEKGGWDYAKANLKDVRVLRQENGGLKSYRLDMKKVMKGNEAEQFYLRPQDIIFVPERFQWF
jgi:polysaccharide export outer membrane protein